MIFRANHHKRKEIDDMTLTKKQMDYLELAGAKQALELAEARIRALEAALDKRKAELWKYGKHLASCPVWRSASNGCDCGWVTIRSTLAPDKPSSADAFNATMAPQTEPACTCDSTLVTDTSNHQPHCPRYVAETKP